MISIVKKDNKSIIYGLSTDDKDDAYETVTDKNDVVIFREMDTGKDYVYNEDDWYEFTESGSGGGGGGGGDFTTAQVTITNSTNSNRAVFMPSCWEGDDSYPSTCTSAVQLLGNEEVTVTVPIYKNGAALIVKGTSGDRIQGVTVATSVTVTGDAEDEGTSILVYGDCAVTIS